VKIKVGEDDGSIAMLKDLKYPPIRGHIKYATQNYKNAIIQLKITKMPLWAENVGLMTWTG